MSLLSVSGLQRIKEGWLNIDEVDFEMQPFEKLAISGATGSGKTTLLKLIAGLEQPTAGKVLLNGERVPGAYEQLIPGHPDIAYLSQYFELRNNYWVHEILEYARALTLEDAKTLYEVCDITHLLNRRTTELSGGEKQRVALAKQLSSFPKLLVLDEPFSNMDMQHKNDIKRVLAEAEKRMGVSCILVSHDPLDVLSWADKVLVMKDGQIIQQGTPEEVYQQPVNQYSASLFGMYNLLQPSKHTMLANIPGFVYNKGKLILLRPEHFKMVKKGDHLLSGHIIACKFWGSYYLVQVLLDGKETIWVKSDEAIAPSSHTRYLTFKITQAVLV